MAFTPVEVTNGVDTMTAYTADELTQFIWDGWWQLDAIPPPLTLAERFAFGPVRPVNPRPGTVYIATPV